MDTAINFAIFPSPHFTGMFEAEPDIPLGELNDHQLRLADRVWERGPFDTPTEAILTINEYFGEVLGSIVVMDKNHLPVISHG